ncbi:hypothetical protein G4929_14455 [Anaerostipes hadrus]|uniref:phosphoribosyltransferase domain-containing protein n=1 Tax=Anaerostipes hadrus TaxID=649756 RepID=UPI0015702E16|nr:phosphoribosyltransferase domain-containing protein [Anaerostipes hadrus]NSH12879.1 hypothetical protein [Anaerostipes hadrus]NSH21694.1 hypothetical protein [Anaerostipes hadrus]NSH36035.1 hypothetical protein [Anaerostipes hadrus]
MKYKILKKDPMFQNDKDIFQLGKRDGNTKRNFLFLSKWIGKHLECNPSDFTKIVTELSKKINTDFLRNTMCIGFAETATGIGMAIADQLMLPYISTTREIYPEEHITFTEDHSHAKDHFIYDVDKLGEKDCFILIDDEITTGNSLKNMIKILNQETLVTDYKVLSILNWMSKEKKDSFIKQMNEMGIQISFYALAEGEILEEDPYIYCNDREDLHVSYPDPCVYYEKEKFFLSPITGRHYINHHIYYDFIHMHAYCIACEIDKLVGSKKRDILILGHGENIYFPYKVAAALSRIRPDEKITFKTTSRTPIYVDGKVIRSRKRFKDNHNITYHIYNIEEMEKHDAVIFLSEAENIEEIEVPKLTNNMIHFLLKKKGA